MRFFIILFALGLSNSLLAQTKSYQLQKVTHLGAFNHPVIFQSQVVSKVGKTSFVRGLIIVKWGVHVYEVVEGVYKCNKKNSCTLSSTNRVATYESCQVAKKKVLCKGLLNENVSDYNYSSDFRSDSKPDGFDDELRPIDSESEFPARIVDEFSDLF